MIIQVAIRAEVSPYMPSECDTVRHPAARLLYDRKESARQLSISVRSLDYLIANKTFQIRRIGKKVLIPHAELVRYARADHFGPVTGSKVAPASSPRVPVSSDVPFGKSDNTGTSGG